jgi:XTP/dITP diphosphohydrolase
MRRLLYFTTSNPEKAEEANMVLYPHGFEVVVLQEAITELLSINLDDLVIAKAIEGYRKVRVPTFVEHGGLYVAALNELPGCLSKLILKALRGKICNMILPGEPRDAIARSAIAYCDGKRVHLFDGTLSGHIAQSPRGSREYFYDAVFVPNGQTRTFAEMTLEERATISHCRIAYEKFASHLLTEDSN